MNTVQAAELEPDKLLADIMSRIHRSAVALVEAAQLVVILIDKNPGYWEALCEEHGVNTAIIRKLERIGRNQLVPEMFYKCGAGFRLLERMPIDVQKTYLDTSVELLTEKGDSLRVSVANLSAAQARMVFDVANGCVRNLGAQRAWCVDRGMARIMQNPPEGQKPFRVRGNSLQVVHPVTLSRRDLVNILAQMTD